MSAVIDRVLEAPAAPGNWRRAGIEKAAPASFPVRATEGFWRTGVLATAAWLALGLLTIYWPNKAVGFSDWAYTDEFGIAAIAVGALLLAVALLGSRAGRVARVLRPAGPWLVALPVLFAIWEIATAKLALLPTPFFAPPQSLVETYIDDWRRLGESLLHSTRLLAHGFVLGALAGFLTGVTIGWSRIAGYWVHPVLRFVGPVPASALLPLAFFFFPSSYAAAVFLIALATGFPVAVLTWSGVAGVNATTTTWRAPWARASASWCCAWRFPPRCRRCSSASSWGWAPRSRCS
jgi:NitT/TauT family transport system permease protein